MDVSIYMPEMLLIQIVFKRLNGQPPELLTDGMSLLIKLNLTDLIEKVREDMTRYVASVYAIKFGARCVYWVYWLWLKNGKLKHLIETPEDISRLSLLVDDAEHALEFSYFENVKEVNQKKALGFISCVPLKLGRKSNFNLSLMYQDEMFEKCLFEHLPHPSKDSLELCNINDAKHIVAASHISF